MKKNDEAKAQTFTYRGHKVILTEPKQDRVEYKIILAGTSDTPLDPDGFGWTVTIEEAIDVCKEIIDDAIDGCEDDCGY